MDSRDVGFFGVLIALYVGTVTLFGVGGNLLVGRKINRGEDLLYPYTKEYSGNFGSKEHPLYLFYLFYTLLVAALGIITTQVMTLRGTIRSWLEKLMSGEGAGNRSVSPASSNTSLSEKTGESGSDTSLTGRRKKKRGKKREQKPKVPNVMRSSVVDPKNQVIPSLPRLSMREDTTEKLSRVLMKFDSMDHHDDMHEDVKAHLEKEAAAGGKKNK